MPLIEVLRVSETDLMVLEVSGCTRLRELRCDETKISQLQVENLLVLEKLYINRTVIKRLDLTKLPKLKEVIGCTDNGRVVLTAEGVDRW